ncbi:snoRNA-binding rRNA-processing protein imp4 [Cyanidiococcus yangmingshanensis]|uniref:SnoRNA-binding rRNA-processing protein imp4 n=1 Tax=Cyanidiococcus yangmingshanensis TaxID=2690220 RepID=A0A7J7IQC8_9RHOD|nr:snoRNA-binding rRNA-processing protein imp4 [Cyanidiococcus yangmingshanensis]
MISLRRQARLRREYLYRKSLEAAAAGTAPSALGEKKRSEQRSSTTGVRFTNDNAPGDEQANATTGEALRDPLQLLASTRLMLDDEYALAGVEDPKIVVTTSRDPSSRLAQFAKERINRGNLVIRDLIEMGRAQQVTDLILLHETRGEPDALIVCHLPLGPTAYFSLSNVVMRHDVEQMLRRERSGDNDNALPPVSEAYPHVIFEGGFPSRLGIRVKNILRFLFPVPKTDSKRIMAFVDRGYDAIISFRHYVVERETSSAAATANANRRHNRPTLVELGPRFDLGLFRIRLGTMDQMDADDEWRLAPYTRAARKRRRLFG